MITEVIVQVEKGERKRVGWKRAEWIKCDK